MKKDSDNERQNVLTLSEDRTGLDLRPTLHLISLSQELLSIDAEMEVGDHD
jgi:hypothetical protein